MRGTIRGEQAMGAGKTYRHMDICKRQSAFYSLSVYFCVNLWLNPLVSLCSLRQIFFSKRTQFRIRRCISHCIKATYHSTLDIVHSKNEPNQTQMYSGLIPTVKSFRNRLEVSCMNNNSLYRIENLCIMWGQFGLVFQLFFVFCDNSTNRDRKSKSLAYNCLG
jgi:hypothetical protein